MATGTPLVAPWLESIKPRANDGPDQYELFNLLSSIDWEVVAPSLGHIANWPHALRSFVQVVFRSVSPHFVVWGPEKHIIYNVHYWREIALEKHPKLMGQSVYDAWAELRNTPQDPFVPLQKALDTGQAIYVAEQLYLLNTPECPTGEEKYISYDLIPLYNDSMTMSGVLVNHRLYTRQILDARIGKTMRAFLEASQELTTFASLRLKLQKAAQICALDFPVVMLFVRPEFFSESSDLEMKTEGSVRYECWVNAGTKAPIEIREVDFQATEVLHESEAYFIRYARQAHQTRKAVVFQTERWAKYCLGRAHGKTSYRGRISPIYSKPTETSSVAVPIGFTVLAFSPCRPVDEYMLEYAETVDQLIATSFRNIRVAVKSQARLDEVTAAKEIGERFFRVVDGSPVGISLLNWKTKETELANPRWRALLGSDDLEKWRELVCEEDVPRIDNAIGSLVPDTHLQEYHIRLKREHMPGKPALINVTCTFHHNKLQNGQIATFLATAITDVSEQVYAKESEMANYLKTERLEAAKKLQEERADAAEKSKARQLEYIDTLAHEVRNPISAIVQSIELLTERLKSIPDLNDWQASELQRSVEDLETVDICTTHMTRVINDALNISKLEHGSLSVDMQYCDLFGHIKSVLRMLRQDMKRTGIDCPELDVDMDWLTHVHSVKTDAMRYKQILINLMTNAIKFTANQTTNKSISVKLSSQVDPENSSRRLLSCAVTDTGRGMSTEAVTNLFGKFYQGSSRTHVEYGGSGLGLFISQRLAVLLNGRIEVTSEIGSGSTFTFIISAETKEDSAPTRFSEHVAADKGLKVEENPDALVSDVSQQSLFGTVDHSKATSSPLTTISRLKIPGSTMTTPIPSSPSSPSPNTVKNGHTVLVIEDNLINQKLLVRQLTAAGYHVLVSNHGREALAHFASPSGPTIDLVVTDIEMPVMDGLQTIKAVQDLELPRMPPFIACSAYARTEQREEFLRAGMVDVIAKPFKFVELKQKIEHLLKSRHELSDDK